MIPKSCPLLDPQNLVSGTFGFQSPGLVFSQGSEVLADEIIEFADEPSPLQREQNVLVSTGDLSFFSIDVTPWNNRDIFLKLLTSRNKGDRIRSIFYDPDDSKSLFFEADTAEDVSAVIGRVPECVRCRPATESAARFCNYTRLLHVQSGRIVRMLGGEFDGDYAQVVEVMRTEKKVRVKVRPRIDYDGLRRTCMSSQQKLNAHNSNEYRAPQVFYDQAVLANLGAEIGSKVRVIGMRAFPLVTWDGKEFYGRFQYAEVPMYNVLLNCGQVPATEIKVFEENVFGLEKEVMNLSGLKTTEPSRQKKQKKNLFPSFEELALLEKETPKEKKKVLEPETKKKAPVKETAVEVPIKKSTVVVDDYDETPVPGDRVVPLHGPFASVPCIVDKIEGDLLFANVDTGPVFWVQRPKNLKVIATEKGAPPVKRTSQGVQTTNTETGTSRQMSTMQRMRAKTASTQDEETECSLATYVFKPRVGDLAVLKNGTVVCVISDKECIDTDNKKHSLESINRHAEVADDRNCTDARGNRVTLGDRVRINELKRVKNGKVLHAKDDQFFIESDRQIMAVPARSVFLEVGSQDVIDEDITFRTSSGSISDPRTIISMDTTGKVIVSGRPPNNCTRLEDYGKQWTFASIGISRTSSTHPHRR